MDEKLTSAAVEKTCSYFAVVNNGTEEKPTVRSEESRLSEKKTEFNRTKALSKSQEKKNKQKTTTKQTGNAETTDATNEKELKNKEQSPTKGIQSNKYGIKIWAGDLNPRPISYGRQHHKVW